MKDLIYFFIGGIIPFLLLIMANIIIHFRHYSTYSRVYKLLPTYIFEDLGGKIITTNQYPNIKIVWFKDTNDFKLDNDVYLFGDVICNFDPIHLYWYIKYKQWFKENVK